MNGTLDSPRFEDLVSDLVLVALDARQKFDASFGQSESTFVYRRCRTRIADWYRRNYGDRRSHDPLLDPRSAMLYEPRKLHDVLAADDGHETDEPYAEAAERLGQEISAEGRDTLHRIAIPLVAGFRLPEIGTALGLPPGEAARRLARLRAELGEGGGRIPAPVPASPLATSVDTEGREDPRPSNPSRRLLERPREAHRRGPNAAERVPAPSTQGNPPGAARHGHTPLPG